MGPIGPWIIPVGKSIWTWNKRRRQRKRDREIARTEAENYVRRSQGLENNTVPNKEVEDMLQGKLTYTAIAAVLAPLAARLLGVDVPDTLIVEAFQLAAGLVALYGRWRANRS
jgi:hypothetical protein